MKLTNKFIGQDTISMTQSFTGGDSQELFEEHLLSQPDDWYYRTANISYIHNDNGHRCKNISEVNLDNYVLFTGCSHTEGIGLELEKSYPYLTSHGLGYDYYNLAVSATGIDVVEHNIIVWLSTVKKKPKIIFIQWPDYTRFLSANPEYKTFIPHGTWTEEDLSNRVIVNGDLSGAFAARRQLAQKNIQNVAGNIPIIGIMMTNLVIYNSHCVYFRMSDKARDLSHAGMKSHQELADQLITQASSVLV